MKFFAKGIKVTETGSVLSVNGPQYQQLTRSQADEPDVGVDAR